MNFLGDSSGHHWLSFALGAVAGLITVLFFKLRHRKEDR